MKVLGFSAPEILPALLKTFGYNDDLEQTPKDQTVRKAWKEKKIKAGFSVNMQKDEPIYLNGEKVLDWKKNGIYSVEKPAHYKVGETVQVMWKQRTSPKGSWFCQYCGSKVEKLIVKGWGECACLDGGTQGDGNILFPVPAFPKLMGYAKITDVFQVELSYINGEMKAGGKLSQLPKSCQDLMKGSLIYELAEMDGFKSAVDMFEWFDKAYDLSKPRQFWVYRFEKLLNPELV